MSAFTDADAELVTAAINDASGYAHADDSERWAPYVLRALADAGRLTPADARHAWGVRLAPVDPDTTVIRQCSSREDAEAKVGAGGTVVTRLLGPWVAADGTP